MTESNGTSLMQAGDALRRSMTRNSHYSHTSTHSWVVSNQQNPPPPPPDDPGPLTSPVRASRPLPDPVQSPAWTARPLPEPHFQAQHLPQLHPTNADPNDDIDEEEYMNIDPNLPELQNGEYLSEGMGPGRDRSFVGGFVNGLRRLPRVVLKYRNFGDKRKYVRKATYGSGATLTSATDMTTGNTLPLYVSNPPTPVASPSNTRYVEAMEMPVPHPADPPAPDSDIMDPSPSRIQHRHPSFHVTPPSDEAPELQPGDAPEPSSVPPVPVVPSLPPSTPSRPISNAVTIFNIPGYEEYPTEEPSQDRVSSVPSVPVDAPEDPVSPELVHPLPAANYRKMTRTSRSARSATMSTGPSFSSQLHPVRSFFVKLYRLPWIAPERVTADYRPGSHGKRRRSSNGFKKPMESWYRGNPGVVMSVKTGNGDGNGNDEMDMLSSNSGSRRTSMASSPVHRVRHRASDHQRRGERQGHRSHHRQQSHHHHRRARNRNTMSSTSTDYQLLRPPPTSTGSPLIPAVYPYPYAFPVPYQAFSTPPPLPPIQPQRSRTHSGSHTNAQGSPRGPRPHRSTTTTAADVAQAYQAYQPVAAGGQIHTPPPVSHQVFLMHSPAQTAHSLGEGSTGPHMVSPVFVPMSLIPGAFPQEHSGVGTSSPPPVASSSSP